MGTSEDREAIRKNLERSLSMLFQYGLIEQDQRGNISVSSLGNVVALKGISCLTADDLAAFLREVKDREVTDLEILHAAASSDDGKRVYVNLAKSEHMSRKYENILREIFSGQEDYIGSLLLRDIKSQLLLTKARAKNLKLTLLLDRRIRGKDTPSLERDFESYYGTITTAAETMSWIVDAASLVAKSIGSPKPLQKKLVSLSEKLLYGVEERGLDLARLRVRGLGRAGIKKLVTEGFETKEAIRETSLPLLSKVIPEQIAINLKEAIEPKKEIQEIHGVAENNTAQITYACQDHIEITGRPLKKRNKVFINGYAMGLTDRSLEIILRLAVALKGNNGGWVHKDEIASNLSAPQLISRLRSEIRNHTLNKDGKFIESDGDGHYRLSVSPNNVIIDIKSLSKHWNAIVRDLTTAI